MRGRRKRLKGLQFHPEKLELKEPIQAPSVRWGEKSQFSFQKCKEPDTSEVLLEKAFDVKTQPSDR